MRIYDTNLTGTSVNETGKAQEAQRTTGTGTTRTAGVGGSEDHVELSNTLGVLSRTLAADNASRAEQVGALAAQYASGNHRADSNATSHGILSEALAHAGA